MIIIFDEAHNVERICEDSASAELSTTEVASAMDELTYILDEMKQTLKSIDMTSFKDRNDYECHKYANEDENLHNDLVDLNNMPVTLEEIALLKSKPFYPPP